MKFRNDPMIRLYESIQEWLQERARPVGIIAVIVVVAVTLYTAGYYFFSYRQSQAAEAFARAHEKYSAPVAEAGAPDQAGVSYADANTKWKEAAEAFEKVASDHSSYYGSTALYYAGTAYLNFDREKGIETLQRVAEEGEQPTAGLASFALAEAYAANGETARAIELYEKLVNSTSIPSQAVNLALGRAYEKSGDAQKAVDAYFEAARIDRSTAAGADAEKRLAALAPERVKELPPTTGAAPIGS
jgi:tetratricopeptide (TPR) repeat protein